MDPFFVGEFGGKPCLVDRDGIPIAPGKIALVIRALAENVDISWGQIEQARKDFARRANG